MRDFVLLAITLACSLVALRSPFVGLGAFVFYGFFAPQTWVWSIAKDLPHSQIIGACTVIGYFLSSEFRRFPVQRETVLMALLWMAFAVSTMFAFDSAAALQKLILVSKILLVAFLSTSIVRNQKRLHILLMVMGLALGLYSLKGGFFFLRTGGVSMVQAPEGSFLSANNSLGLALVVNLPILFYLIKVESNRWLKHVFQLMLVFSYPAIIGTFSRGAWIAGTVVTLLLFLKARGKTMLLLGGVVFSLVLVFFPVVLTTILSERVVSRYETLENVDDDPSSQSRLWSWEFCKRVGLENLGLGLGFDYYSQEAYAKYYPEMLFRWPGKQWSCHSMWLTVLSEHGVVGFFLWISLLISCFISLREVQLYGRSRADTASIVWLADSVKASLIGLIIGGTFLDFAYFDGYYELVAIVVVSKEIVHRVGEKERTSEVKVLQGGRELVVRPNPASIGEG